jgi:hypothetical protein
MQANQPNTPLLAHFPHPKHYDCALKEYVCEEISLCCDSHATATATAWRQTTNIGGWGRGSIKPGVIGHHAVESDRDTFNDGQKNCA